MIKAYFSKKIYTLVKHISVKIPIYHRAQLYIKLLFLYLQLFRPYLPPSKTLIETSTPNCSVHMRMLSRVF